MNAPDRDDPTMEERTRRIAETWRGLEPSATEVAAARMRFVAGSTRSRRLRATPGTLALAIVLAASGAFGGARVVWTHMSASTVAQVERPSPSPTAAVTRLAPSAPRQSVVVAPVPSGEAEPPLPEPVVPAVSIPTTPLTQAPRALGPASIAGAPVRVSSGAPAPRSALPLPPEPPAAPAPLAASSPASSPPSSPPPEAPPEPPTAAPESAPAPPSAWSEAAEAMRVHDYPRAERAFDLLVRMGSPRTRDEARLARAQVWMAEGRAAQARPELASLAATGATSLVRERAGEALGTLR